MCFSKTWLAPESEFNVFCADSRLECPWCLNHGAPAVGAGVGGGDTRGIKSQARHSGLNIKPTAISLKGGLLEGRRSGLDKVAAPQGGLFELSERRAPSAGYRRG